MSELNNNKLIDILNELLKPILAVIVFIRDVVSYAINLFCLSWRATCASMNKDILIPSFIAMSLIFFLYNIIRLIDFSSNNPDMEVGIYNIITIISLSIVGWGFTVIASVKKAKELGKDAHWRKHLSLGFKSLKFFASYCILIIFLITLIMIVSYLGLIPHAGQTLLSLLEGPVFFLAIIIILSILSLLLGSLLFGGFYFSDEYNESLGFIDRTKNLFCMVGRKFLDCFAVIIPAFISSSLVTVLPLILMLIALGDIIQKPTASLFNEGQRFPGITMQTSSEEDRDRSFVKGRSLSYLSSIDYHYRYPSSDMMIFRQQGFNEVIKEYNANQKEYDEAFLYSNAIKILGFSNPGRQLDSLDAFEQSNPGISQFEGVDIYKLRQMIEQGSYQFFIDNWNIKVREISEQKRNDLISLGGETLDAYHTELLKDILKEYYIANWEEWGFGDKWTFTNDDKLILDRFDDFIGEKYIVKNGLVYFYSSEYNYETDSFGDLINTYIAPISNNPDIFDEVGMSLSSLAKMASQVCIYVGHSDSYFFVLLTEIFLAISDALILAFAFMFFYAAMGSIFYRLYNSSFSINVFQKIIAICLILVIVFGSINYIKKESESIISGIISLVIGEDSP